MNKLVSVILPCYNEEESLAEEIRKIRTSLDAAKNPEWRSGP